jgi:MATE family multidrug resistance protein
MLLSAALFIGVPGLLARIYTSDLAVVAMAASLIPIAGVFQVFDGLQVVAIGILRGVGDTRAPMVINVMGFWLLGFPASLALCFWIGLGATGLWWGLVVGLAAVALLLLARVHARMGRELKRLIVDEEHAMG